MVAFCFETVNWSPYVGFEKPDLGEMIRAAASTGYRWISFDLPRIAYYTANDGPIEKLRDEIESHGLRMLAVYSLAISEDIPHVEKLARAAVETGKRLGASFLHAGITTAIDASVIEATRRANLLCRDAGQELAMEFMPILPLSSIAQTHDVLNAAEVTGRNFVIDTWHFFNGPDGRGPDKWSGLDSVPADRIAYVQFNDHGPVGTDLLDETINRRLLPGEGIFELEQFAAHLRAAGFDGVVGPELLSQSSRGQPVKQVAQRLIETSAPFWR